MQLPGEEFSSGKVAEDGGESLWGNIRVAVGSVDERTYAAGCVGVTRGLAQRVKPEEDILTPS